MDDKYLDEMVEYMLKLDRAFERRGIPIPMRMNIYGFFFTYQFNGVRNDLTIKFKEIMKSLGEENE